MLHESTIQLAQPADFDALGSVMFDAVRNGESPYTDKQRQAWTPAPRSGSEWHTRLAQQAIYAAFRQQSIDGFMSLRPDGYVDLAYIRPAARGAGLFRRLYCEIENEALRLKLRRLFTHASLMAEPAFSTVGFTVVRKEFVDLNGERFERFEMDKLI